MTQSPTEVTESTVPILAFDGVSRVFPGEFVALENVTFSVMPGEFVSIVGASGAGKSTLLRMVYAEDMPTAGTVYFNGRALNTIKRHLLPFYRRNIGTVFQDFKLLQNRTVFENVAYALEVQGAPNAEIEEEVPQILEIVGLEDKMEFFPRQLSGGEQQRVALARALIHRPKVIVADEPTGNLDPISTWEIVQLLLKINEFGTTVLLATHNKNIVDRINRRVITLDRGRIVRDHQSGVYAI